MMKGSLEKLRTAETLGEIHDNDPDNVTETTPNPNPKRVPKELLLGGIPEGTLIRGTLKKTLEKSSGKFPLRFSRGFLE